MSRGNWAYAALRSAILVAIFVSLFALLISFAGRAQATPVVIAGDDYCTACAARNTDWERYLQEILDCVIGPYTGGICADAKTQFEYQWDLGMGKGITVSECSTLDGGAYGCQKGSVYWEFTKPPQNLQDVLGLIEAIVDDLDLIPPDKPYVALIRLRWKLTTPDGHLHEGYIYPEDLGDYYYYPPPPFVCPHPWAGNCQCNESQIACTQPPKPTGLRLIMECPGVYDVMWNVNPYDNQVWREANEWPDVGVFAGYVANKVIDHVTTGTTWTEKIRSCNNTNCTADIVMGTVIAGDDWYCN